MYSSFCRRRRWRSCIPAVAGTEAVQHADSDAGWRLGRRDSGLNLEPETPDPPMLGCGYGYGVTGRRGRWVRRVRWVRWVRRFVVRVRVLASSRQSLTLTLTLTLIEFSQALA